MAPAPKDASSLSFIATNQLRETLLTKNLPSPYEISDTLPVQFTDNSYRLSKQNEYEVVNQLSAEEIAEPFIEKRYLDNRYGPPGGYDDSIDINVIRLEVDKRMAYPYFSGFYCNTYTVMGILLGVNSEGQLNTTLLPGIEDDSQLAQLAAVELKKAYNARVAQELYEETVGRLNVLDAFQDPFAAVNILSGRESLIEKQWKLTMPRTLVGKGLDFVARLQGLYLPVSIIPGQFFGQEANPQQGRNVRPEAQSLMGKIWQDATALVGNLVGVQRRPVVPLTMSDRLIDYTGSGQKSVMFRNLTYNRYKPEYRKEATMEASTAIGRLVQAGAGVVKSVLGTQPPQGQYYVGTRKNDPKNIPSPNEALPQNEFGELVNSPVYGPDALSKEFENFDGNEAWRTHNFGLAGKALADGGGVAGGWTWYGKDKNPPPGQTVGPNGVTAGEDVDNNVDFRSYKLPDDQYNSSRSGTDKLFRPGTVLDVAQRLVEAVPEVGGARLGHVGHAIDQVSKVFNDGYKELTKGSQVRKYVDSNGSYKGAEYCRIFTKDTPFYTYNRLQKTQQNIRKESYSVLDSPYNLNIAPYSDEDSTNIINNPQDGGVAHVKKYMFSLENLAWRTSNDPGLSYTDLAVCERGPNGGRIMWFPPYDIAIDDNSSISWSSNNFLGRPEPIYTYNYTERIGNLRFRVVVDHPTVLNRIVDKELGGLTTEQENEVLNSFFAGCYEYDIFDLSRTYPDFDRTELETILTIINQQPPIKEEMEFVALQEGEPETFIEDGGSSIPDLSAYDNLSFYFENDYPDPNTRRTTSTVPYTTLAEGGGSKWGNYIGDDQTTGTLKVYYQKQPVVEKQKKLQTFFEEATENYNVKFPELMVKLEEILSSGEFTIDISFIGSASSPNTKDYNVDLSKRRIDSVKKMILAYQLGGKFPFQNSYDKADLRFPESQASGEEININGISCTADLDTPDNIYSINAAYCRRVHIETIKIERKIKITKVPTKRPTYRPTITKDRVPGNLRRKITRHVLGIDECSYFKMIRGEDEIAFASMKEKLKYFSPAFHSTTPEGLNSRLTFLQQCLRPGKTIPVKGSDDNVTANQQASNTAFGAPPVCVLRIGDFYHSKIIIDNVSISYDPLVWDINPEGIGVQPMIANVSMNFKYIGGQGLKQPVEQLQNALSFNYYANTETFDERAQFTVFDTDPDEKAFLQDLYDSLGTEGNGLEEQQEAIADEDTTPNDGQPIGNKTNPSLTTSGETGDIEYNLVFNDMVTKAGAYISTVINEIKMIQRTHGYGMVQLMFAQRDNETGTYDCIDCTSGTASLVPFNGKLIGKIMGEERGNNLFDEVLDTIKSDGTIIQTTYINNTNPSNSKKRKLRRLLKEQVEEIRDGVIVDLDSSAYKINEAQIEYTKLVDKINTVNNLCDGYINDGKHTSYKLSGTTHVFSTSNQTTTDCELGYDYKLLANLLNYFTDTLNGVIGLCSDDPPTCYAPVEYLKEGNYQSPTSWVTSPDFYWASSLSQVGGLYLTIGKKLVDTGITPSEYFGDDGDWAVDMDDSVWEDIKDEVESGNVWDSQIQLWSTEYPKQEKYWFDQLELFEKNLKDRFVTSDNKVPNGLTTPDESSQLAKIAEDSKHQFKYGTTSSPNCEESITNISEENQTTGDNFNFKYIP